MARRLVACLLLVAQCAGQTQVDVSAARRSLEAKKTVADSIKDQVQLLFHLPCGPRALVFCLCTLTAPDCSRTWTARHRSRRTG
jgi:hypothetical protein